MNAMISARPLSPSGKLVARILRQRLHPFADGALRVADLLQDRVHLRVQPLQFALAHLVDFVGRHRRGGRRLERPAVELLAVRPRRDARIVRGDGALRLQFAELPLERGRDLLRRDRPCALGPVAGNVLGRAARSTRRCAPPSRAFFADSVICASALSIRNAGGTSPAAARGLHPAELSIELLRIRLQPRQVRLGIRGVLDAVIAVEEAGNVEIRADVLDDDVRRVAPAADSDVAVRKREAFERGRIGASHDLDAGARGMRQPVRVEGFEPVQIRANLLASSLLPRPRSDRPAGIAARRARRCRCPARSRSPARDEGDSQRSNRGARVCRRRSSKQKPGHRHPSRPTSVARRLRPPAR